MSTTTVLEQKRTGRRRRWTTEETEEFLRLDDAGLIGKREFLWDGEIIEAMGKNPPTSALRPSSATCCGASSPDRAGPSWQTAP